MGNCSPYRDGGQPPPIIQKHKKGEPSHESSKVTTTAIVLPLVLLVLLAFGTLQPGPTPTPTSVPLIANPGKWSGQGVSFEVTPDGKIINLKFTAHYISGGSLNAEYLRASEVPVNPDGTFGFKNAGCSVVVTFNSPTTASFTYEIFKGLQGQTVSGTETTTVEWKSP